MKPSKLTVVLGPPEEDTESLRWRATVPLGTNPFLLAELAQFALMGACVVLLSLCVGVRLTEGAVYLDEILTFLHFSSMMFLAIIVGFVGMSVLFFGNRYFATFRLDETGIYHEGSRGRDESRETLSLSLKPYPVTGALDAHRTRSRRIVWEKVDRFRDFPEGRVIHIRRGRWNMVRVYTPDMETHTRVVAFLRKRLTQE
jgi:hypothetical protein